MDKKYKIHIPKACKKQAWSSDYISEKEKLCLLCSEKVFDATSLNDKELFELVNSKNKPRCIQVKTSQLNRELNVSRSYNNIKKIMCSLLVTGLLTSCSQIKNVETTSNTNIQNVKFKTNYITGTVLDKQTQLPIKNAIVSILDREISTKTNSKGQFKIKIPKRDISDTLDLEIRTKKGTRYYENFEISKYDLLNKTYLLEEKAPMILLGRYF